MFILRVEYKTGQRIDFAFAEKRGAIEAREAISEAKKDAPVLVVDDGGHEAEVRNDGILALVVTDIAAEVVSSVRVQQLVEGMKAQMAPPSREPEWTASDRTGAPPADPRKPSPAFSM